MQRNITSKIIFSKQCDHDLDLMPFWLGWYRDVFKADKIFITPVKTPKSSIAKTVDFYESQNIEVYPIHFPTWDDGIVWKAQLDFLKSRIGEKLQGALVISADTDQFFSPVRDQLSTREAVFRRVFIYSDQELTKDTLKETRLFSHTSLDLVAGFYSELDNERIHATGHFAGISPRKDVPCEFHLALRGIEQFLNKIKSLDVEMDDSPGALHWKNLNSIYAREGEAGLRREYDLQITGGKSLPGDKLHKVFRSLAEGEARTEQEQHHLGQGLKPAHEINLPFASQVIGSRFEIHMKHGTETRYLRYPINEAFTFNNIFQSGAFEIDRASERPPDILIDIGANIGLFSVYMKSIYLNAEIHAFEGNPDTYSLLKANLASLDQTFTYPNSWSDQEKTLDLYRHPLNSFEDSTTPHPEFQCISNIFHTINAATSFDGIFKPGKRTIIRLAANGNEEKIILSLAERLYLISDIFLEMSDKVFLESLAETLSPIFSIKRINSSGPRHIAYLISKNNA